MTGRPALTLSAALVALTLSGCSSVLGGAGGSSGGRPSSASIPSSSSSPSSSSPSSAPAQTPDDGPRSPLTGLPAADPAAAARPVVAVPLLTDRGFPAALASADVVYQEVTTPRRVLALYQSRDAAAGPVAPTRPSDVMLLAVLRPAYAFDRGTTGFLEQVRAAHLGAVDAAVRPEAFRGPSGGRTVDTAAARRLAGPVAGARQLYVYASGDDVLARQGVTAAHALRVDPGDGAVETWTYGTDGRWHLAGTPLAVTTVLVQRLDYKQVRLGRTGRTVADPRPFGRGTCVVASGPSSAPCSWSKPGYAAAPQVFDPSGVPVRLRAGSTWVVLGTTRATVEVR